MPRIWLPFNAAPKTTPKTEREDLMQRIDNCNYLIPGAEDLELSQLRDLTQYVEYKTAQEKMSRIAAGAAIAAQMSPEQVKGALREYLAWRNRKQVAEGNRQHA